jgi:MFS transporter, FHS family, glucose/mannose:H+ symporter
VIFVDTIFCGLFVLRRRLKKLYDTSVNKTGAAALPGFLLSGFLFALLGALLPAWGYHLDPEYSHAGQYFLCLAAGVVLSGLLMRRICPYVGTLLTAACCLAWLAMIYLALVGPPVPAAFRLAGWVAVGFAGGLLNTGLFETIRAAYQTNSASTINMGGVFFGLGCLASALLLAGTFYLYTVPTILLLVGLIPGFFAIYYRQRYRFSTEVVSQPPAKDVFRDFLTPGAVMFSLLLFFQSGNEWALAGWLPLFLIRRLGLSPEGALWILAIYWLALLIGRVVSVYLLTRIRHSRLLLASAGSALFGCLLLMLTTNRLGATVGVLFCGAGFAVIYPLVVEKIGGRFPYYHPGIFNSIFSIAIVGGLLAPWLIGMLADSLGAWVVMGLPVLGTLMVVILLLLIWLESKVTGR